jgi:serine protease Do
MKTWVNKTLLTRRLIMPVMAVALALSFTTYEFIKPAYAKGPVASPTATPLDDNSIGALLSLDQAMETLAARVTPAVVNVAVTSHGKTEMADGQMPEMPEDLPPIIT